MSSNGAEIGCTKQTKVSSHVNAHHRNFCPFTQVLYWYSLYIMVVHEIDNFLKIYTLKYVKMFRTAGRTKQPISVYSVLDLWLCYILVYLIADQSGITKYLWIWLLWYPLITSKFLFQVNWVDSYEKADIMLSSIESDIHILGSTLWIIDNYYAVLTLWVAYIHLIAQDNDQWVAEIIDLKH